MRSIRQEVRRRLPGAAAALLAVLVPLAPTGAQPAANPFDPPAPAAGRNPFDPTPGPQQPQQRQQPQQQQQRVILRVAQMVDPGMGNMPSHTILVPDGWKLTGGAWWPTKQELYGIPPSQLITVAAPDGRAVMILPGMIAVDPRLSPMAMQYGNRRPADGTSANGVRVATFPDSPEAWRAAAERNIFRVIVPDAQDLRVDPITRVPALSALLQRQLAPLKAMYADSNRQSTQYGASVEINGDVFATLAHYTLGGKRFEHLLIFGSCCQANRSQLTTDLRWTVDPAVTYRAEEGQLSAQMPLLMAVANSLRMTDAWAAMKADHLAKMSGIAAKGNADRAGIWADSAREIGRTITEGYNDRSRRTDATADNYTKGFRGVDDYVSVNGGAMPVQLPHDYARVFGTAHGEYILTNDVNYDPNTDQSLGGGRTWSPMQPAR